MIFVVAISYNDYVNWMKANFIYFRPGPSLRTLIYVNPDGCDNTRGYETGTCYFNPFDVDMPEWFVFRFTRIRLDDTTPKTGRFSGLGG